MLTALGAAFAMELVGVSMALGAFLTGMMLSVSDYRHQIEASVEPFKGLLIGLFFISVGMSIDLALLVDQWLEVVGGVAALMSLKIVTLLLLGLVFGLGRGVAIRTSFILCQCGEFGFVLFGAAVAGGLLTDTEFTFALMLVTVTMLVTPLMAKAGDALATRFAARPVGTGPTEAPGSGLDRHVVVAGYGRGGRIVCLMLEKKGIPFIAYDNDPERVALGKRQRHDVHFGDMSDPNVLDGAGLSHAIGVVVTINDVHQVERLVSTVLNFYPAVPVYARARDFKTEHALLAKGVRRAVPEAAESSVQLGKAVLQGIGVADSDLVTILEDFRRDDYALIRPLQGT
jgi:glutathione-regulated potassium-efflux system protein KefB